MAVGRELGVAAALAVGRDARVVGVPASVRAAALAWLPLAGLLVGAAAALVAAGAAAVAGPVGGVAGVLLLRLGQGPVRGRLLAAAVAVVEAVAVTVLPPAARALALVVAPALARWAMVVQCYGGRAAANADGVAALAGRAGFREFAVASVTALGVALVALDAVGLAVAVACAIVTLACRVVAYRRRGGIDRDAVDATSALVETSALVLLAAMGRLLGVR